MDTLQSNLHFLCDESRMLCGMAVAFGTPTQSETARYGRAQEVTLNDAGRFIPRVRPLEANALFDLASLTKLFTAVLAMMLVERGRLALDVPVSRLDSRFEHLTDVTVADVLSFRACLQTPGRIDDAPTREEGLTRLFTVRRVPLPAVRIYSDINAMVIKYVIEAVSGMAFADALKSYIFTPAGLTETFAAVPEAERHRCVCYNYEHRIMNGAHILRTDTLPGVPHDPKAAFLSQGGRDLCGHAGLFSTQADMIRFAQALLSGALVRRETLLEIGQNRTGCPNPDGTHRQYLGYLCFAKHPSQYLSEVPEWMGDGSIGLSGFTGNHLSLDPVRGRFVLFLGNRCHARLSHIAPRPESTLPYGLAEDGIGLYHWPDGHQVPSSVRYVHFKDARLHAPIAARMREMGWL